MKKSSSPTFNNLTLEGLTFTGNTIASTATNGNIILDPKGTGVVEITASSNSIEGGSHLQINYSGVNYINTLNTVRSSSA